MRTIVPDYYFDFKCIADKCRHTCCIGWEIDIDEESLERFKVFDDIWNQISFEGDPHFILDENEKCPFLCGDGLCEMILEHGEDSLCQICTDHPRYRNFWSDRCEMGLGLVCEEAARIILTRDKPMQLVDLKTGSVITNKELPDWDEDIEGWLLDLRSRLLLSIKETGPMARLREYLIFRHIPDALYDDRLSERIAFVDYCCKLIKEEWDKTDGSIESLIEIVRTFSYDVEYDEDKKEEILSSILTQ